MSDDTELEKGFAELMQKTFGALSVELQEAEDAFIDGGKKIEAGLSPETQLQILTGMRFAFRAGALATIGLAAGIRKTTEEKS